MVKLKQEKSDKADTDDDGNEEDYEDFMYSLTSWGSLFLCMFLWEIASRVRCAWNVKCCGSDTVLF
jgi:hypothetical protein